MGIGDIVVVDTTPPHIASVISDTEVLCEDGSVLQTNSVSVSVVCTALQVVKALEKGVLDIHETG